MKRSWWGGYAAEKLGRSFRRARPNTAVYCITEGLGLPVKVGHSIVFDTVRFGQLQAATWRPMKVCWVADGTAHHEAAIKHILREQRHWCEWYADPNDRLKFALPREAGMKDLEALIDALAQEHGNPGFTRPRERRPRPMPVAYLDRPEDVRSPHA
ncbi:hypothetical protein DWF04_005980 [Cereibacter sphaeroides f. sp. denitrificans]|nr:hypothetical protein DWF04_06220 [Cereibacter sphaeroides f. sp. denitrificans]